MQHVVFLSMTHQELQQMIAETLVAELDRRDALAKGEPLPTLASPTDMMTRPQVLEALHCSDPTLRNLEKRGLLSPNVRMGRKPLWRRRDVERYLAGKR